MADRNSPRFPLHLLDGLEGVNKLTPGGYSRVLFFENDPADRLFVVESGLVRLLKRTKTGRRAVLSLICPGQLFGESALLPGAAHDCSAEVVGNVVVHSIPAEAFRRLCQANPEISARLAELLALRVRKLHRRIELFAFHSVRGRVIHSLVELSEIFAAGESADGSVSIPLAQSDLAHLVLATRETTSVELNALARHGLIRLGRCKMLVSDPGNLRAAAESRLAKAAAG